MAQLISDRRDIDFVLYEQLQIEELAKTEKYRGLNRKMFDMVISEARNLGITAPAQELEQQLAENFLALLNRHLREKTAPLDRASNHVV